MSIISEIGFKDGAWVFWEGNAVMLCEYLQQEPLSRAAFENLAIGGFQSRLDDA